MPYDSRVEKVTNSRRGSIQYMRYYYVLRGQAGRRQIVRLLTVLWKFMPLWAPSQKGLVRRVAATAEADLASGQPTERPCRPDRPFRNRLRREENHHCEL